MHLSHYCTQKYVIIYFQLKPKINQFEWNEPVMYNNLASSFCYLFLFCLAMVLIFKQSIVFSEDLDVLNARIMRVKWVGVLLEFTFPMVHEGSMICNSLFFLIYSRHIIMQNILLEFDFTVFRLSIQRLEFREDGKFIEKLKLGCVVGTLALIPRYFSYLMVFSHDIDDPRRAYYPNSFDFMVFWIFGLSIGKHT